MTVKSVRNIPDITPESFRRMESSSSIFAALKSFICDVLL